MLEAPHSFEVDSAVGSREAEGKQTSSFAGFEDIHPSPPQPVHTAHGIVHINTANFSSTALYSLD